MDIYPSMDLDTHFNNHIKDRHLCRPHRCNVKVKPNFALEVIQVLKSVRKTMPFSEIIKKDKFRYVIEQAIEASKQEMESRLNQM